MQIYSAADLVKARKLQRRRKFQGLDISIETRSGAFRHWYDPHAGEHGKTRMPHDYGYIRGTMGADGEHVDCYIGPDPNATHAYVVKQMKAPEFKVFDEQKVMLGFGSELDARRAYATCYDRAGFLGGIKAIPMGEFRKQVLNTTKLDPLVKHDRPEGEGGRPVDSHAARVSIRLGLRKAGGDAHLVHQIFEDANPGYPPVTHVFTGKDRTEAKGYFDAHMKTDAFMRGMERSGKYDGIRGRTEQQWMSGRLGLRTKPLPRLGIRRRPGNV